jgi:hypothetical protein
LLPWDLIHQKQKMGKVEIALAFTRVLSKDPANAQLLGVFCSLLPLFYGTTAV